MPGIKAVIFDCDGVLVDSEPISNRVLIEMANELGANLNLEYAYDNFKGNSLKNCIILISELVPLASKKQFEKDFRERSFRAFEKEIQPIAHIEEALNALRLPYAVASSGPQYKIELNLKLTGLLSYFENRIYSCYTIQKWKPEPDVFLWAAQDLKVAPEECLVVEDSIIGIEAALSGGFKVAAYNPENSNVLTERANRTFSDMLNLNKIIKSFC
jgi:HAD superfamily hydrolase (TIGR01509 family)